MNRSVVVVLPKASYLQWYREIAAGPVAAELLKTMSQDGTAYLLPSVDSAEALDAYMREISRWIFEDQLQQGCEDRSRWPADRSWKVFRHWFEVYAAETVIDLAAEPIGEYRID